MSFLEKFYPDERVASTYDIDFKALYKMGYRGIIFDIDNTLVPHGEKADERAIELFDDLYVMGFRCCLLSNNDKERVQMFHKDVLVEYIFKAEKPKIKNYLKALEYMETNKENTLFIGDQIFTDIFGAKRAGIRNVLVNPIDKKEEFQIVLKRFLEKIVLHSYEKQPHTPYVPKK